MQVVHRQWELTKTETASENVTGHSYDGQRRAREPDRHGHEPDNALQLRRPRQPAHLLQVALPGGPTIVYAVDGRSRRIAKQVNGTTTKRFVYRDGLNPVAELDGAGAVLSRFVYGSKPHVPDYLEKGGASYRTVSANLNTVAVCTQVGIKALEDLHQAMHPAAQPSADSASCRQRRCPGA